MLEEISVMASKHFWGLAFEADDTLTVSALSEFLVHVSILTR